ncbi:MAG: hypothetical protein HYV05_08015, partial [Deltaproteobacteria bacterium]|nr:hypothetical protein [Deltaproteobacteria bacterium]
MGFGRELFLDGVRGSLLPLLAGILLALPFVYPLWFPAAWLFMVPLFFAVHQSAALKRAFFLGWLAGGAANLLGFYWIDYTIRVFGGFPHGASQAIFLVFAAYGALPLAFFALLVR